MNFWEVFGDFAFWGGWIMSFGWLAYALHVERKNERLEDKIDGLESDLENAVETAFKRGATEWVKLNYPTLYLKLKDDVTPHEMAEHLMKAPFSDSTVSALNAMQERDDIHPYTCPGNYPQCANHRNLIATPDGWVCVCGQYTQSWARK